MASVPSGRTGRPDRRLPWRCAPLLLLLAGCAGMGAGGEAENASGTLAGTYRGSFDSALTADPDDDLNINPCNPATGDCGSHQAPLADILVAVEPTGNSGLSLAFYRSADDRRRGRPLDLLGDGCGTRLGPITGLSRETGTDARRWTASVPLTARNRACLGRLRPTSEHALNLIWHHDPAGDAGRSLVVLIDRRVTDANHLYVVEDGVRRRVRIDLANRLEHDADVRYRVCIEDDLGEYGRCVMTDREFRQLLLPVPLPGGAAVSYTWWRQLTPRLRSTRGLYHLEQYRGRFVLIDD
jgi:hypothetical protein